MNKIHINSSLKIFFSLTIPILLSSFAYGTDYSWFGGTGSWEDKTNWVPEGVPGNNDVVYISSGNCETAGATVQKVFLGGGTLKIVGSLTVTEEMVMTDHKSVLTGEGNLNIGKEMAWGGGDLRGPGEINIVDMAILYIGGEENKDLYRTINNQGKIEWTSHDFNFGSLYGDGIINNYGNIEITSNGAITCGAKETIVINNYGIIEKKDNMNSALIQPDVNNYDRIIVSRGKLSLEGSAFSTGNYSIVNSNDTLRFVNGIHSFNGCEFTGDGVIHIDLLPNGRFSVDSIPSSLAFGTTLYLDRGVINGSSDIFDVHGDIIWEGGTVREIDTVMLHPTSHMTIVGDQQKTWSTFMINKGVIDWKFGDLTYSTLYSPTQLGLLNENVFNLEAAHTFADGTSGNGFINNVGLLRRRDNAGLASIRAEVNNRGQIEIQTGTLDLYGGGSFTNYVQIDSLATLGMRQNSFTANDANFTGKGNLNVELSNTSSLRIDSLGAEVDTMTTLSLSNGLVLGNGQLHIYGKFDWNAGELRLVDTVFLHQSALTRLTTTGEKKFRTRLINNGDVVWNGGLVRYQNNSGQPYFENNNSFHIQCDEIFGEGTLGNGYFVNNGLLSKTMTEELTSFKCHFTNNGDFNQKTGSISMRGGSDFTSSKVTFGSNATLRFQSRDHILDSTFFSGAGRVVLYPSGVNDDIFIRGDGIVIDTATIAEVLGYYTELAGDGPIHLKGRMNWGQGGIRVTDTLHIYETGLLNMHSDPDKELRTDIVNHGEFRWIGGNVKTVSNPMIENYGTFIVMSPGNFGSNGNGSIINYSKTKKIFSSSSTIRNKFINPGSLEIEMGKLAFTHSMLNDTTGSISGTDTLDISGITIENHGKILPGLSIGELRVLGDLPNSETSNIVFDLGGYNPGTDFDVLAVEGDATFSGNMVVQFANDFEPSVADTFQVMTFESFLGSFDSLLVPDNYSARVHYDSTFLSLIFDEKSLRAPSAVNDTLYIMEDQTDTLNVLKNDINRDNLTIQLASVENPATLYGDSSIIYNPAANYHGMDSLEYKVNIEDGTQYLAKVYIFIEPVNDPPSAFSTLSPANSDMIDITTGPVEFSWSASSDVDGDPLVYKFQIWSDIQYDVFSNISTTNYTIEDEYFLQPEKSYYWNIGVTDGHVTVYSDTAVFITRSSEVLALGDEFYNNLELEGNYPNPFMNRTTIAFNLQEDAQVSIDIYALNGNKILSFNKENLDSGHHEMEIDASDFNEGMFIYKITAKNEFSTTVNAGKMLLKK